MCGICGIIKSEITKEDLAKVKKMNNILVHRGPDDEGYFNDRKVAVGMRRLSIIDLDGGRQPLYNEDKTIVLVANAEIYNYIELRKELKNKGHIFKTNSDCETIIHAYEEYGEKFVEKLRGMFAFFLYDIGRQRVYLVRDRMAEKPLYYYWDEQSFVFASEMKAIINIVKNPKIDNKKLDYFFTRPHIAEPDTLIKQVKKIEAASYIIIELKKNLYKKVKYWNLLNYQIIDNSPERIIKETIEEIIPIIVRADVPIGISLSGGLDSSIIALLTKKYSLKKIQAFTVGYSGRPACDERLKAKRLARELGIAFNEIELSVNDVVKNFFKMIYDLDDPVGDIAAFGYYQVAKEARKNGVPVILNGIGADELFWGYSWVREAAKYAMKFYNAGSFKRSIRAKKYIDLDKSHLFSGFSINSKRQKYVFNDLYTEKFKNYINEDIYEYYNFKSSNFISANIIMELLKVWLYPNCNVVGDRLSMAASIELRSPFLDYKLVERVIGLTKNNPKDFLLPPKQRLKQAFSDIVPNFVLKRKKRGFEPPILEWQAAIIKKKHSICLDGYAVKNGLININNLKKIIHKSLQGKHKYYDFLYRLIVFEAWYKTYIKN